MYALRASTICAIAAALFPDVSTAIDLPHPSPDGDAPVHTILLPAGADVRAFPGGADGRGSAQARGAGYTATHHGTEDPPEGDIPSALVFTPDGSRIVIAHRDTWNLVVKDAVTLDVVSVIRLSGGPQSVAVTNDGTRAVTANLFEDTASIVDLASGEEIAVVGVGAQPGIVRISPTLDIAVVGNTVGGSLSVIDVLTATETQRIGGVGFIGSVSIAFEPGLWAADFTPFAFYAADALMVPDFYADLLHFVNITTGLVTSIPVTDGPRGVAVTPDGTVAVVSHAGAVGVLSVVQPLAQAVIQIIPTIDTPWGPVAINPSGTKAVVAVANAARIADLSTGLVSLPLDTASFSQVYTTADGLHALTIGYRGSLIDYASETIVANLNTVVSTPVGNVSPAGPRGAMVANVFGEDLVLVSTDGAAAALEAVTSSGPPPDADRGRLVALSADGRFAIVSNVLSDNVSILRLPEGSARTSRSQSTITAADAVVAVGDRPAGVAFTPDASTAVVTNLDSNFLSVIDVAAALDGTAAVTNVPISTRGSQVVISPDGVYAYVAVVADGDGVWRVNLQTLSVEGPKLPTGDMGSIGFAYSRASGLALSHDGLTLVTCDSITDTITLIDTATWSVVATVPVGDLPARAIFSSDDATIYVSLKNADGIAVVANAGALSSVSQVVTVGDQPFEMLLSPDEETLYVTNVGSPSVGVVDLQGGVQTTAHPLPDPPVGLAYDATADVLVVPTGTWLLSLGPGPLIGFEMRGTVSALDPVTGGVTQSIDLGRSPSSATFVPVPGGTRVAVASPMPAPASLVPDAARGGEAFAPVGELLTILGGALVAAPDPIPAPAALALALAPNPTSGDATITFALEEAGSVSLTVYDTTGRRVATLARGVRAAGSHAILWDGRTGTRRNAPGVYVVRLEAAGRTQTEKLILH